MTEKEITDAGFEKKTVPSSESSNGYDYYFYDLDLCEGVYLVSTESDLVVGDNWKITSFDIPALNIETVEHLNQFLELVKNLTGCENV